MTKLPEKFSDGIRLAVEDMKKCSKSTRYKINMYMWHTPETYYTGKGIKEVCQVCMGGAVMAKTLKLGPQGDIDPWNSLDRPIRDKVVAFNSLRGGYIKEALYGYMKGMISFPDQDVMQEGYSPYEESPAKFYKWCLTVADELEKRGY